jgi:hypothetical protein
MSHRRQLEAAVRELRAQILRESAELRPFIERELRTLCCNWNRLTAAFEPSATSLSR